MPALFVRLSFSPALLAYGLRHGPVRSRLRDATCGASAQRFQSHQSSYEGEPQQFRLRGLCDDAPSRFRGLVSRYAPKPSITQPSLRWDKSFCGNRIDLYQGFTWASCQVQRNNLLTTIAQHFRCLRGRHVRVTHEKRCSNHLSARRVLCPRSWRKNKIEAWRLYRGIESGLRTQAEISARRDQSARCKR